jgi:hypothetical protein
MAVQTGFMPMVFKPRYHDVNAAAPKCEQRKELFGGRLKRGEQPALHRTNGEHVDAPSPSSPKHVVAATGHGEGVFAHLARVPRAGLGDRLWLAYKLSGTHVRRLQFKRALGNLLLC